MKAFKLYSDNFEGVLVTPKALKAARREMSSGDYGCHKAIEVEVLSVNQDLVIDYDFINGTYFYIGNDDQY